MARDVTDMAHSFDYQAEQIAGFFYLYGTFSPTDVAKIVVMVTERFPEPGKRLQVYCICRARPAAAHDWLDQFYREGMAPMVQHWIDDFPGTAY